MRKEKRNRREARTGDPRTTNAVQHSQQNSNKDNIVIDVRAAFLDARVIPTDYNVVAVDVSISIPHHQPQDERRLTDQKLRAR